VRAAGDAPEDTRELVFDITDGEATRQALTAIESLDAVVANAGIAIAAPLEFLREQELARQLDVNVVGQFRVVQPLLPLLRRSHGRVVLMGSIGGRSALPFLGAYAMSKFALEAFADSLRVEVAHTGTKVGCAYFSFIDTDMVRRGFDRPSAQRMKERLRGPLKPPPVSAAGAAIARGIEKRARFVYAPRWVLPVLYLRTVLQPLSERGPRGEIEEAMRLSAQEPTELTTPQPGRLRT